MKAVKLLFLQICYAAGLVAFIVVTNLGCCVHQIILRLSLINVGLKFRVDVCSGKLEPGPQPPQSKNSEGPDFKSPAKSRSGVRSTDRTGFCRKTGGADPARPVALSF